MPLEFIPLDELRRQLEVNVIGQVAVTQAFLPHLRRTRGRIVFVGSIAGKSALPFLGAYAASKHALEAIADALRIELRPFGIAVSLVEPGTIRTPIWEKSAAVADSLVSGAPADLRELYGERIAAFRRVAAKRGASGASAEAVARAVDKALTQERPSTRKLIGRDARRIEAIWRVFDERRAVVSDARDRDLAVFKGPRPGVGKEHESKVPPTIPPTASIACKRRGIARSCTSASPPRPSGSTRRAASTDASTRGGMLHRAAARWRRSGRSAIPEAP